jgi:hypothetical protein
LAGRSAPGQARGCKGYFISSGFQHFAGVITPSLQVVGPETFHPLLQKGWQDVSDAIVEVQSPTAPLGIGLLASHVAKVYETQVAGVNLPFMQLDAPEAL